MINREERKKQYKEGLITLDELLDSPVLKGPDIQIINMELIEMASKLWRTNKNLGLGDIDEPGLESDQPIGFMAVFNQDREHVTIISDDDKHDVIWSVSYDY